MTWLREFDLTYWQMREALGYPIPDRIDRRFRLKLAGNGGHNPFQCGSCGARRDFPAPNIAVEFAHWPRPVAEAAANLAATIRDVTDNTLASEP